MNPHVWSLTHWISCPVALLACACVAQTVSKQSASSDPSSGLVISDVTVISSERAAPLEHAHVRIRDGRIEEVSERPLEGVHQHLEEVDFGNAGRYVSGTKTSRRCRFHSATASLTRVTPTRCPSVSNSSCNRVAVSRCLPPVHRTDSASNACTRPATASQTGRGRGPASALGAGR